MTRLKIALMAGGDSPEREIALQSAAQIESALDHEKYDITVIDLHHRDWHYTAPDGRQWQVDKNDFSLTVEGERKVFDYALIIIHGTPGEDGRLQGYLENPLLFVRIRHIGHHVRQSHDQAHRGGPRHQPRP